MAPDAEPLQNADRAKVFISYSRKDLDFVDRLDVALKARGFEPLIDRSEIYAFEDWWKRLQALIDRADTVVFVLSPDAVASREALREVEYAASLNKRFAPIVCRRVDDAATPEALRRLNFVFFDDPAQFEGSADRLADALKTDIGWIRKHTEYGEAARQWAAAGRPGGLQLRSPALEDAERWIASRPANAPAPTADTQAFIAESRRGATRRRNILTGSLAAGLVIAMVLAGLAYWQRGVAVEQRKIADQQRQRAEDTLAAATKTANSLVFDLAQRFRDTAGIPASLVKDILDRARALQAQLMKSGQVTPALKRSEAAALDETAQSLLMIGDANGALAAAVEARQIVKDLIAGDPNNADFQHGLALAASFVGEVQWRQGKLMDAVTSFQECIAVLARLINANPSNGGWKLELASAAYELGNIEVDLGNLQNALALHRASLKLKEELAAANPNNASLQRELSLSYERIGDLQRMQGNLQDALTSFRHSLGLRLALAQADPNNTQARRNLSIAYERIGQIDLDQKDLTNALGAYRNNRTLRQSLAESDPNNMQWQRDLAAAFYNVGDVQLAQNNLQDALASYQAALAASLRAANADPGNTNWQRGLGIAYEKMGDVEVKQNNLQDALASYRDSLSVRQKLTKAAPDNAEWQGDLAMSYAGIGDVYRHANDHDNALAAYKQGQAIMASLAKASPDNARWQRELARFNDHVAALTK